MAEDNPGAILSKEERRDLLAQIERESRRTETPETTLERAVEALRERNLDQARRLADHLEKSVPGLAGLADLRRQLAAASEQEKRSANLRTAEDMLIGYIQQRKKKMAVLALETLLELAPDHPRAGDYRVWVGDLDQEVALQKRIDEQARAVRAALHAGDVEGARRALGSLERLDPQGRTTEELQGEIDAGERGRAESADIGRMKQRIEELLERGEVDAAESEITALAQHDLPKITLDFLRKRLADTRRKVREEAERQALHIRFQRHLEARDWRAARELAQRFGERFPESQEGAQLFHQVSEHEGRERRQQSLEQGLSTLESFIAGGKRREAELVLKVLRSLDIDPAELARCEARVRSL